MSLNIEAVFGDEPINQDDDVLTPLIDRETKIPLKDDSGQNYLYYFTGKLKKMPVVFLVGI